MHARRAHANAHALRACRKRGNKKIKKYFVYTKNIVKFAPKNLQKPPKAALFINLTLKTMNLKNFTEVIDIKDEIIPKLCKILGVKGYLILWYMENKKEATTITIAKTLEQANKAIKMMKRDLSYITETKIIKL